MKKNIIWYLAISLLGLVVGYILSKSDQFGICIHNDLGCSWFFERTGAAVLYGFGALSVVFVVLFFLPVAFRAWKKFAIFYIPIAILIFLFYPDPGSGDFLSPHPSEMFRYVGSVYILLSLIVIGVSYLKNYIQKG